MPRTPRIILDENLFFGASDYHAAASSVVKRLREKFGIEATYVGVPIAEPCPIRKFKRSNPTYVKDFTDVVRECEDKYSSVRSEPHRAISDFKNCINENLSRIDADASESDDAFLRGCVPPRGCSDSSIRAWADANDVLIISCDGGRELESHKTDRILITCPSSGDVTAEDIVDRLRSACYK